LSFIIFLIRNRRRQRTSPCYFKQITPQFIASVDVASRKIHAMSP